MDMFLLFLYNCGIFPEQKKEEKNNSVFRRKQQNWAMFGIPLEANGLIQQQQQQRHQQLHFSQALRTW